MTYPKCQTQNPEGAKFCGKCGISLVPTLSTRTAGPDQLSYPTSKGKTSPRMNWKEFFKPNLTKIVLVIFVTISPVLAYFVEPLEARLASSIIFINPFSASFALLISDRTYSLKSPFFYIPFLIVHLASWYFLISLIIYLKNNWRSLSSAIKGGFIAQTVPLLLILFTLWVISVCEELACILAEILLLITLISIPILFVIGYLIGRFMGKRATNSHPS